MPETNKNKSPRGRKTAVASSPRKKSRTAKSGAPLVDPQQDREASNYENPIASRELILQVVRDEGAISHDELQAVLGMNSEEQVEALRRRTNAMVRDGQLIRNRRDGYIPVNEEDLISGRVIAHADGFGFLVPDEGDEDIFLHGRQMRTLLHGDRAVVQVSGIDRRGRQEGTVIEVLERANHRIVGRLFVESGVAFVVADNKRITQDIMVPLDQIGEAEPGQIVIVEITQQPTFKSRAVGRITDIIGDHMAPGMEIDVAIHAHNIPFLWPDDVKEQVKTIREEVTEEDKKGRKDITGLPLVTIDGEDARDFDDAVYCEKTSKGWKLYVAIADVSHYVQRGSPLDEEAINRSTSVYFPERVIPMLPEVLSNGLCSLNPEVDRLCMVCEMLFDAEGKMTRSTFYDGVMYSHARLTYEKVSAILEHNDQELTKQYEPVVPHLHTLFSLYKKRLQQRKKRGSIDFETTETRIIFDESKHIERIVPTVRNEAHKIIEECMIAANIAAARFLEKHKIPGLYRVHKGPKEEKLEDVKDFIAGLGLRLQGNAKGSIKRFISGIGDRIKGKKKPASGITAQDYARLIERVRDRPDFHLIQTVLLRSLSQAVYSPENEGHFGLSLDNYAHFTSPIRRYPDLLVHRAIRHITQGKKPSSFFYRHSDMVHLGEHCSTNERRADEATRDAVTALKCEYMQSHIGETFQGIITSVTGFGVFVELNDIYIEGLIHITSLPKDYYQFEPVTHRLVGEHSGTQFQLGDSVRVNLVAVNMDERKIDFELVEHENNPRSRKSSAKSSGKKSEQKPEQKSGKTSEDKPARKKRSRRKKSSAAKQGSEASAPQSTDSTEPSAGGENKPRKKSAKRRRPRKKQADAKKADSSGNES